MDLYHVKKLHSDALAGINSNPKMIKNGQKSGFLDQKFDFLPRKMKTPKNPFP